MALRLVKSRKISPSEWEQFKPDIRKLYLKEKRDLKFVMEEMEKQGFIVTQAQYRSQFLKWGPAWKKNERSEDRDVIAIHLIQRSRAGQGIVMYRWGELVSDEEVDRIKRESRVSPLTLHGPECPQLPKGIRIDEKRNDPTAELIKGLPYLELERKVYVLIGKNCNQFFSGNGGAVELRALLKYRALWNSGQIGQIDLGHLPANNLSIEPLASNDSALSSILPYLPHNQMPHFGASLLDTWEKVRIPEVHRQVLCG